MYLIFKFVITNEDKNILSRSKYLGSMCIFLRRPLDLLFYGMTLICFLCPPARHQQYLCSSTAFRHRTLWAIRTVFIKKSFRDVKLIYFHRDKWYRWVFLRKEQESLSKLTSENLKLETLTCLEGNWKRVFTNQPVFEAS